MSWESSLILSHTSICPNTRFIEDRSFDHKCVALFLNSTFYSTDLSFARQLTVGKWAKGHEGLSVLHVTVASERTVMLIQIYFKKADIIFMRTFSPPPPP